MCKYFVLLYHVIHYSSCMCVCALSFGNVVFALMTPKIIRGCVTVTCLTYVFPYKGMHSPNDLINLIEVQLTVIQFKLRFH